jgi:predicted Zn-dependent protease
VDRYALHLLQDIGYSNAGLQRFFREMAVQDHGHSWSSTHPHSAERLQAINAFDQ